MKLIISLCAVIAVVSALKQEMYKLPPETLKVLKQFAEPCAAQFNVDPINVKKLADSKLPRDQATNNFLYCFGTNSGFIDKDGHSVADVMAGVVEDPRHVMEFRKALEKCAKITKDDPVATAVAEHICLCEISPILFDFASE